MSTQITVCDNCNKSINTTNKIVGVLLSTNRGGSKNYTICNNCKGQRVSRSFFIRLFIKEERND